MDAPDFRNAIVQQRWMPFINTGSQEVPSFGVLEVTGSTTQSFGSMSLPTLQAKRPTKANLAGAAINSHTPVAAGAYGICTFDGPMWALYDDAKTPSYGESWGTQSSSFELKQWNTGFTVIGGQTSGRFLVDRIVSNEMVLLNLPYDDTDNYLLPGDTTGNVYGNPYDYNEQQYDNDQNLTIKDIHGSCAMPGQRLFCRYNSHLSAWEPIPQQNMLQKARTYKNIPAGTSNDDGSNVFLLSDNQTQVVEMNDTAQNFGLFYDHADSELDITGSESEPSDLFLYMLWSNGGLVWQVIGRECPK